MQLQTRILIPLLLPLLALASACREDNPSVVEPEPAVTLPLDTTSHDFVWEYDTVGIQLSAIHGVAAVATDDIWVTGQFYRNDSLGKPDPRPIGNAAHWNGREWTMHTYNSMGRDSNYELWDAKAFGANNIWLCGGSPFRWDGVQWKRYPYKGFYFNSGISDIWSSQDQKHVCAVGYKRSLVLYSPEEDTFKWVDMPHDEHFYDVNGTDDGTIYVAGGNPNNGDSHIYRIDPDGTVNTWLYLQDMLVLNTWFLRDTLYVTAGKMIYQLAKEKTNLVWEVTEAAGLITDVEMSAANNIVAVTEKNTFLHYNGSTWKEMPFAYPKPVYATDLAVFDKHVYIVGYTPEQYCLIMHGTRL